MPAMKNSILTLLSFFYGAVLMAQSISTGVVSNPLCAGATVSVPFTRTGTYSSANVFTAQLSNAAGSFTSPVVIGTLAGTASGTITALIPANTPAGTGYRIRVVSSSPVITGGRNSNGNLTVNAPLTPAVTITSSASGSTLVCPGTPITFTATVVNAGPAPLFSWLVNHQPAGTNSATFTSSTLQHNDTVYCIVTAGGSVCTTVSTDTSNIIIQQLGSATNLAWRRKSDLFQPGVDHSNAIAFSVGEKGYMTGGNGSTSLWAYDPATDQWTPRNPAPVGVGKGFSIGDNGYVGSGSAFWRYDPVTDQWTSRASFPGGSMLIAFSIQGKGYGLSNTYFGEYDPITDQWTARPMPPRIRNPEPEAPFSYHTGFGFSIGSLGYVGGGINPVTNNLSNDFYEYNPNTLAWTKKASLGDFFEGVAISFGGKGYVGLGDFVVGCTLLTDISGVFEYLYCYRASNIIMAYDPVLNTWSDVHFPGGGRHLASGFAIDNMGFILGGRDTYFFDDYGVNYDEPNKDTTYSDLWVLKNDLIIPSIQSTYCPGDSLQIQFETGCIRFNPDNVFTAQIHDGGESIAQYVPIGTVSSSSSGSLLCILPTNLPSGNNYQIRIISSSPPSVGISVPISIIPIVAPVAISGPKNIFNCAPDSLLQYSVPIASTAVYNWAVTGVGNSVVSGQGSSSVLVQMRQSGQISVFAQIINTCGATSASSSFSVVRNVPIAPGPIKKSFSPDVQADPVINNYFSSVVAYTNVRDTFRIRSVPWAKDYIWDVPIQARASRVNDTCIAVDFEDNLAITPSSPQYIKVFSVFDCSISQPFILTLRRDIRKVPASADQQICLGRSVELFAEIDSLTDIDGTQYPTTRIGNQVWMAANLKRSTPKSLYYGNDSLAHSAYGRLYSPQIFAASSFSNGEYAMNTFPPPGWHIPNLVDVQELIQYITPNGGGKLKDTGSLYWNMPNVGATNEFGFNARGAGSISTNASIQQSCGQDTCFFGLGSLNDILINHWIELEWSWWATVYYPLLLSIRNESSYINIKDDGCCTYIGGVTLESFYSIRFIRDQPALTYQWSTGATTRTITVSPTVTTSYYCTVSDGLGTYIDTFTVRVTPSVSSTPGSVSGLTDVCTALGTSASSTPVTYSIRKVSNAVSYSWTVPSGATLLSGQGDTSITVRFSSSFVSGAIGVRSVNPCGTSSLRSLTVYKRVVSQPVSLQTSFVPSVAAIGSVCGLSSGIYRTRKVTYASSYVWTLRSGTRAQLVRLSSPGLNDTVVQVNFQSGFTRDTLSVRAVNACSVSSERTFILSALYTPPSVSGLSGNSTPCVGGTASYTATSASPTSTQSSVQVYRWTRPNGTTVVSSSGDSASLTLSFLPGYAGGTLSVRGQSACGVQGTSRSLTLRHLPPTPTGITASTGSYNACAGTVVTYTVVVPSPSTTQVAAVRYRWILPAGSSLVSSTSDSMSITVQFSSGFTGGALSVRGVTSCGVTGTSKTQSLGTTGCRLITRGGKLQEEEGAGWSVEVFPNPTAERFGIWVRSSGEEMVLLRVRDALGRLRTERRMNGSNSCQLGEDWSAGVYWLEVFRGGERKLMKLVKY